MRQDRHAGEVVATIVNLLRKKGDRAVKWTDIYPEHDPAKGPRRRMSDAEIWKALIPQAKSAGLYAAPKKGGR